MLKNIISTGILSLLAVAIVGTPVQLQAQEKTKPATATESKDAAKGPRLMPFRGKLKATDSLAKTFAVGTRVFQITPETKITKGEKAATLVEGVVGEQVSGAYMKAADGKLMATKVHFGPKAATVAEAKTDAAAKKEAKK